MKYKVGDKVRIVGNKTQHGFNVGDIVVIEDATIEGLYVASCFEHLGEEWFVSESDVGFFMDLKLQTPMEIVDSYYESKATPEIVDNTLTIVDDPVESPSHYSSDKIECVDYLKDNMPFEAYLGGLEWNVKKYLHRWRRKGKPVEDLLKSRWYLNRLIDELQGKGDA